MTLLQIQSNQDIEANNPRTQEPKNSTLSWQKKIEDATSVISMLLIPILTWQDGIDAGKCDVDEMQPQHIGDLPQ